jgi:hypothetical protein
MVISPGRNNGLCPYRFFWGIRLDFSGFFVSGDLKRPKRRVV